MSDYNGWTNRETWAVNLWLNNDEDVYRFIDRHVPMEGYELENLVSPENIGTVFFELIALDIDNDWGAVNWNEIAEAWNEE